MSDGLIRFLVEALVEAVLTKTGRGLWGLFGLRPHDLVSMFSGVIFWTVVGIFAYARMHG
ncbi:hypothetical protein JQ616_09420 [Bradyrhizobium tropiciagri]|uniref:hypothetical protein n=1 Tax=Bradyrhizobium tropiciagri TaxID=312253 RepID=UPI001BAB9864|nr:hypothetical protein [Bradyrhizobium tropiciagri]MBR0895164.1 hypothetical protein [Bradyrhizobium tropiciagri]